MILLLLIITLCFFSRVNKCAFISFFIHSTPFFFFELLSKRISPHYKKAEEKKTLSNHPS